MNLTSTCIVYNSIVDSVEGGLWMANQTPHILCHLPSSNSHGIFARNLGNRCRNKWFKIIVLCYVISEFKYILKRSLTSISLNSWLIIIIIIMIIIEIFDQDNPSIQKYCYQRDPAYWELKNKEIRNIKICIR